MSKFLAPIHHWLFNKIQIHEDLERDILDRFKTEYGPSIDPVYEDAVSKYGHPLIVQGEDLEEIIDLSNIHGWLQSKIDMVEGRQSYLIKRLLDAHKAEALGILDSVFSASGSKYGKIARNSIADISPESIYSAIYDYLIDGMPCDNVRNVTSNDSDSLEYSQTRCLHNRYWDSVNLDFDIMYSLRDAWLKSFVESLSNGEFKYEFSINGNEQNHRIVRC